MPNLNKKQFFTFKTFSNGLSNDPTNWKTHGYYAAGMDLIGIKDMNGNVTGARPNVLQLSQQLSAGAVSSTTDPSVDYHLIGLPEWIRRWDAINAGDLYAFAPTVSSGFIGQILRQVSGAGAWVSSHRTTATIGGGGLGSISATMYYGQDSYLGQLTSALAYNDTFGQFTKGGQTPRPMKVFAGVLNIGNDNYISTVDSSGTFTAAALTLPSGYVCRSLEVLGDYLVISADYANQARIFLWTGGTATFQEAYDLPETVGPILVSMGGRIYAIGRQIYQLNEVSFSTVFPTSFFGENIGITTDSPTLGEVTTYRNRILYSLDYPGDPVVDGTGNTSKTDSTGGVWMMAQQENIPANIYSNPFINHLHFLLPTYGSIITSPGTYKTWRVYGGGIYCDADGKIRVGYQDNVNSAPSATYGIATYSNQALTNSTYAYYLTLPINCDTDSMKIFHSIRITLETTFIGTSEVDIYYRLDPEFASIYSSGNNSGVWTLLKAVTSDDLRPVPIRKKGKTIQFKFMFPNGSTAKMLDWTLAWENLDQYRN